MALDRYGDASSPEGSPAGVATLLPTLSLKKILVPVDFSDCSKKALWYAVPLARQFGGKVTLLHTVQLYPVVGEAPFLDLEAMQCQMCGSAQRDLDTLRQTIDPNVPSEALVCTGNPYLLITRTAAELEVDLIVISTHGHTGLRHALLGSTAERVVRHASCPVLVVRECEHEFVSGEFGGG